jgi:hypothetical protein
LSVARLRTLTLAAILLAGGAAAGLGQSQPDATKPAAPVAEKKSVKVPGQTISHGYLVHQSIEVGARITRISGSTAMWDTMVNQEKGVGGRVLGESLELHSVDRTKTPFFDTLSSFSTGYGGDPYDVTRLSVSKGRLYDFVGSFRRDRNFFDYNQFANSLLTNYTPAIQQTTVTILGDPTTSTTGPLLVPEANTLHLYNTVRHNTDALVTFLPLSAVSYRIGINHGTHEGPSLTTSRSVAGSTMPGTNGGDMQVYQWFRNGEDRYTAGVDAKIAKRTMLNYDEFVVMYKGDSSFSLPQAGEPLYGMAAPAMFPVAGGTTGLMATSGVDAYNFATTVTTNPDITPASKQTTKSYACGNPAYTGGGVTMPSTLPANNQRVTDGVMQQDCKAATVWSQSMPIRSIFPTEQLRFSSHYWDRFSFNGRVSYSGGHSDINSFSLTSWGYGDTAPAYTTAKGSTPASWSSSVLGGYAVGAGTKGQYAVNKRANLNGDFGFVAEVNQRLSISDNISFAAFRTEGNVSYQPTTYAIPTNLAPSLLTTSSSPGVVATTGAISNDSSWLNQKTTTNTVVASYTISQQIKVSGGWRYRTRGIDYLSVAGFVPTTNLSWRENAALIGAVIDPGRMIHLSLNYDLTNSGSADPSITMSNAFTRITPDKSQHFKARATVKPAKWINFAVSDNDYFAKNDDPLVNHQEHSEDISFAASVTPRDGLNFDVSYAHDDVYSVTDICYQWTPDAVFPNYPAGAATTATCLASNSPNGGTTPGALGSNGVPTAQEFLSNGYYNAPSNYYSANVNYAPTKSIRLNGGARLSQVNGSSEALDPFLIPGALHSRNLTPFADAEYKIAEQWAWHGNWNYTGYGETGPLNTVTNGFLSNGLPARNMHGNILTLGVKYAF